MDESIITGPVKAMDNIQRRLTDYAWNLDYDRLSADAVHAAKVRVIDTLGALIGGFFGESCRIARNLASQMPNPHGASVLGTRIKTTPDIAAFVNGTTARYAELMDTYRTSSGYGGHPSDVVMPVLAVAEHCQVSGRELITGIVLAYEIYLRFSDVFHSREQGFDNTVLSCLGVAGAAGKVFNLSANQIANCISMAVVPNVVLRQARMSHMSMFKELASGHAGRAGVFAAMLARSGMEGPDMPFEGKAGWCQCVIPEFSLPGAMGGEGLPFKIIDTRIKNRPAAGFIISTILAAEKVAPLRDISEVKLVTVEVNKPTKVLNSTGEHRWNPDSREGADHSTPYVVAATLMEGTVTLHSFDDGHLWNPELRALMQKIEVVENEEFTRAFEQPSREHRTRVTVITKSGERIVGETGGDQDDLSTPKSDAQIEEKFRNIAEDFLGARRVKALLNSMWRLDELRNVAEIPGMLG